MNVIAGTVNAVSEIDYILDGTRVFDVEIQVDNPGLLTEGLVAHTTVGASNGEQILPAGTGELRYSQSELLTVPIGGIAIEVAAKTNAQAAKGNVLLRIQEESSEQVERALQRQYMELSAQLEIAQKQAESTKFPSDGCVYAEADGFVTGLTAKPGDTLAEGSMLLTLLPDAMPQLKFALPPKEGEIFGSDAVVSAMLETVVVNDDGEKTLARQTVIGRVTGGLLQGGSWACTAALNAFEGQLVAEQDVPVQVTQKGEVQELVVPLSCIFESKNNTKIVYTINTRSGLFGEESYLMEIPVKVLYDNGLFASVEGTGVFFDVPLASDLSQLAGDGEFSVGKKLICFLRTE